MAAHTKWTTTPPETFGWHWWRDGGKPLPVYLAAGPFGNDAFKPGAGWVFRQKMEGEWWPEPIQTPPLK